MSKSFASIFRIMKSVIGARLNGPSVIGLPFLETAIGNWSEKAVVPLFRR